MSDKIIRRLMVLADSAEREAIPSRKFFHIGNAGVIEPYGEVLPLLAWVDDNLSRYVLATAPSPSWGRIKPPPLVMTLPNRQVAARDGIFLVTASGEEAQELELGHVRVLVLVDQHDAEALASAVPDRLVVAQEPRREPDEVAEVHVTGLAQPLLVEGVDPAHAMVGEGGTEVGRVGLETEVLGPRDGLDHAFALAPRVMRQGAVEEGGLIVVVVDGEIGVEPGRGRVPAEEPGAEGVEGAHHRAGA
jgi:hypothetical protein